jgi:hypothetical protein
MQPMIDQLPTKVFDDVQHPLTGPIVSDDNKDQPVYETKSVWSKLPLVSLFTLRSPASNLVIAPECNQRTVAIKSFTETDVTTNKSLRDVVIQSDQGEFASRPVIAYPFTVKNRKQYDTNTAVKGVRLRSISTGEYNRGGSPEKTYDNVNVAIDNAFAFNTNLDNVKQTLALLDIAILAEKPDPNNNDLVQANWVDIITCEQDMKKVKDVKAFITKCRWDQDFFTDNGGNSYEQMMLKIHRFIMMCTGVFLCFPEGQHRIELASRPVYGYGLCAAAPLKIRENHSADEMIKMLVCKLQLKSPIFGQLALRFLLPGNPNKIIDSDNLMKRSRMYQNQAKQEVVTSHLVFYQTIKREIDVQLARSRRQLLDYKRWNTQAARVRTEKKKKNPNLYELKEVLETIIRVVCRVINEKVWSTEPYSQMVKDKTDFTIPIEHKETKDDTTRTIKEEAAFFVSHYILTTSKTKFFKVVNPEQLSLISLKQLVTSYNDDQNSHDMLRSRSIHNAAVGTIFEFFVTVYMWDSLPNAFGLFVNHWRQDKRAFNPDWIHVYIVATCANLSAFLMDVFVNEHYKPPPSNKAKSTPRKTRQSVKTLSSPLSNAQNPKPEKTGNDKVKYPSGQYSKGKAKLQMTFRCALYEQIFQFMQEYSPVNFEDDQDDDSVNVNPSELQCIKTVMDKHTEELSDIKQQKGVTELAATTPIDAVLILYYFLVVDQFKQRPTEFFKGIGTDNIERMELVIKDNTGKTEERFARASDFLPENLLLTNLLKKNTILKDWFPDYLNNYGRGATLKREHDGGDQQTSKRPKTIPGDATFQLMANILYHTLPKINKIIKYAKAFDQVLIARRDSKTKTEAQLKRLTTATRTEYEDMLASLDEEIEYTAEIYHNLERIGQDILKTNLELGNSKSSNELALEIAAKMIATHMDLDRYISLDHENKECFYDPHIQEHFTDYLCIITGDDNCKCPTDYTALTEFITDKEPPIYLTLINNQTIYHNLSNNKYYISKADGTDDFTETTELPFKDGKYDEYGFSKQFWEETPTSDNEPNDSNDENSENDDENDENDNDK